MFPNDSHHPYVMSMKTDNRKRPCWDGIMGCSGPWVVIRASLQESQCSLVESYTSSNLAFILISAIHFECFLTVSCTVVTKSVHRHINTRQSKHLRVVPTIVGVLRTTFCHDDMHIQTHKVKTIPVALSLLVIMVCGWISCCIGWKLQWHNR